MLDVIGGNMLPFTLSSVASLNSKFDSLASKIWSVVGVAKFGYRRRSLPSSHGVLELGLMPEESFEEVITH